jgi:serine/threonine-protein kinase
MRPLATGVRIGGKYVLSRRLATGGMGDVWLARNETTRADVALKILKRSAQNAEAEDRFRREARLAGLLTHRSIVRIFDFLEESDGMLLLVMEFLRGETLERWVERRGALPEREAMAVMTGVLSALQHGHEQGIVHRDVKPSNIFLAVESDGRVIPKLLDYGIAKMPKNDSKTIDGVVLGTPSYMSPEQIRSEGELDGRSDLFSCGVVLMEMLTGTCPFEAPTPSAAIAAVLQNTVDPDPRISPRLWLEVQRALAKRPKQRHESAAQLRAALLAAVQETEDSLASVLSGVKPRDYGADKTGPVTAVAPKETLSVDGQSVVTVTSRRTQSSWVPWAGAGAAIGAVLMIGAMTREAHRPVTATAAAAAPVATATTALALDSTALAKPAVPPSAPALATAAVVRVAPMRAPPGASASGARARPSHPRTVPTRARPAKPVATSPGF